MESRSFVDEYICHLEAISDISALQVLLHEMIGNLGLTHFVYHGMNMPIPGHWENYLLLSYPAKWIEHYVENNYFSLDPVVQAGFTALLPFDWQSVDKSGAVATRVFGEAGEFGIGTQGLTCPVRGPRSERALFSVTSDLDDASWELLTHEHLSDFVVLAQFLHSKVIELKGVKPVTELPRLGNREKECLKWAASGKTNADIATILNLSVVTVRFYVDIARHKLNCLNRTHAVARAIRLDLIDGDF